jgi:hypothetical protein
MNLEINFSLRKFRHTLTETVYLHRDVCSMYICSIYIYIYRAYIKEWCGFKSE